MKGFTRSTSAPTEETIPMICALVCVASCGRVESCETTSASTIAIPAAAACSDSASRDAPTLTFHLAFRLFVLGFRRVLIHGARNRLIALRPLVDRSDKAGPVRTFEIFERVRKLRDGGIEGRRRRRLRDDEPQRHGERRFGEARSKQLTNLPNRRLALLAAFCAKRTLPAGSMNTFFGPSDVLSGSTRDSSSARHNSWTMATASNHSTGTRRDFRSASEIPELPVPRRVADVVFCENAVSVISVQLSTISRQLSDPFRLEPGADQRHRLVRDIAHDVVDGFDGIRGPAEEDDADDDGHPDRDQTSSARHCHVRLSASFLTVPARHSRPGS